jgi:hypothetical protein
MAAGFLYNIIDVQYKFARRSSPVIMKWAFGAASILHYIFLNAFAILSCARGSEWWYGVAICCLCIVFLLLLVMGNVGIMAVRREVTRFLSEPVSTSQGPINITTVNPSNNASRDASIASNASRGGNAVSPASVQPGPVPANAPNPAMDRHITMTKTMRRLTIFQIGITVAFIAALIYYAYFVGM